MHGICIIPLQPLATYGVPVAVLMIAYGIFAYGLFDMNVVIRRSLVYSILVTLLTVCYFGLVYGVERLFQTTFGYQSIHVSLAAFALMALIFQPLKIGIQRVVDWLFFRAPQEVMIKRLERLEEETRQMERLKAVAILAAGMAHEIKNPLSSIKTFASYMEEKYDDAQFRQKFTKVMQQETDKINALVRRMLDFAKPSQPKLQQVQLSKLIDETVDLLHGTMLNKHLQIVKAYSTNDEVFADPVQIKQVFLNILINSVEAMDQRGCITISTVADNGHLEILMADTGPGIPKQDLPRLFDPFFTTKAQGTGLGLSIVHSIVKEHGGRIIVDSDVGKGTTVRIQLPAYHG